MTEAVRHFDLPILSTLSLTYALQESLHEYDRIVSAGTIQPQFFAATDQPGPIIYLGVMGPPRVRARSAASPPRFGVGKAVRLGPALTRSRQDSTMDRN